MVPAISPAPARKGYLALVAIVKNEASYLDEWIEFHRLVGVEHIYLYDNGSTDQTREVVAPYISQGFVTLMRWASFDATDGHLIHYVRSVRGTGQRQELSVSLSRVGPNG